MSLSKEMTRSRYEDIVRAGFCYKYQKDSCYYQHRFPDCHNGFHSCYQCWRHGLNDQRHGCYTQEKGLCQYRSINFEHFPVRGSGLGLGYVGNDENSYEGDNFRSLFVNPDDIVSQPASKVQKVMLGTGGNHQSQGTQGPTRGNAAPIGTGGAGGGQANGGKFVFRPTNPLSSYPGTSSQQIVSVAGSHAAAPRPSHAIKHAQSEYTESSQISHDGDLIRRNVMLEAQLELLKERSKNREDRMEEEHEKFLAERKDLKQEVSGLKEENEKLKKTNEDLQGKVVDFEKKIERYEQLTDDMNVQINSQRKEFQTAINTLVIKKNGPPNVNGFQNMCSFPNVNPRNGNGNGNGSNISRSLFN